MDILRAFELTRIGEIRILPEVRLIYRHDLNPIYSKENLQVQFVIDGDLKGAISCHLCLDGHELSPSERNYIYPMFVESMNILVGKQLSLDEKLSQLQLRLSPPKINLNPKELNTSHKTFMQKYELELEHRIFSILTEYSLETLN